MTRAPLRTWIALAAIFLGASCINIHIYFPEAEVRQAAEEIVREVRPEPSGTEGNGTATPEHGSEDSRTESRPDEGIPAKSSGSLWPIVGTRAAWAEEKPGEKKAQDKKIELDVKNAVIKKIKETIKARFAKLQPFYEKGAIGEGADGYLALRDADALSLKEKRDVQALVKEENDDRKNLYSEITKSNGIDTEYMARVAQLFSEEWQKKSKAGWWIEVTAGKWEKKKAEGKKK